MVVDTCEIVFQTSGPAAAELEFITFSGNAIRFMAGRVMEKCVEKEGEGQGGGYITRGFDRLLGPVSTPGNGFFEHFRSYQSL